MDDFLRYTLCVFVGILIGRWLQARSEAKHRERLLERASHL